MPAGFHRGNGTRTGTTRDHSPTCTQTPPECLPSHNSQGSLPKNSAFLSFFFHPPEMQLQNERKGCSLYYKLTD